MMNRWTSTVWPAHWCAFLSTLSLGVKGTEPPQLILVGEPCLGHEEALVCFGSQFPIA